MYIYRHIYLHTAPGPTRVCMARVDMRVYRKIEVPRLPPTVSHCLCFGKPGRVSLTCIFLPCGEPLLLYVHRKILVHASPWNVWFLTYATLARDLFLISFSWFGLVFLFCPHPAGVSHSVCESALTYATARRKEVVDRILRKMWQTWSLRFHPCTSTRHMYTSS